MDLDLPNQEQPAGEEMKSFVYGSNPNLTIISNDYVFQVHREMLVHASPVWSSMLTGNFIETTLNEITLHDDDPKSLKVVFDVLYYHMTGTLNTRSFNLDPSLTSLLDKYDIKGVKTAITGYIEFTMIENQKSSLEQEN